ncbi:hypothetical protein [Pseudonocardia sp. TRM90224]|uniref:hypothetical protein n=1 Tax=Pseudonocardia sp. TRM90224 TaxID=2812678 RepID=UPI001E40E6F7|nr:hypothetical protein [Pseudonocardia sp. TRM90224]
MPTALVGAHGWLYGRWIVDDAAITFAYARSIAAGAGPVLQVGAPPVEGYSNPAWMALHVLGSWLGLFDRGTWFGVPDYVAFPKALALVLVAVMFAGFYRVARAVVARPALVTVIAGVLVAATPSFVIWVLSGLENSLLVAVAVWLVALMVPAIASDQIADRYSGATEDGLLGTRLAVWCGLLAAVAALTRPDGVIYAGAFPLVAIVLMRRGQIGRTAAAVAISCVAFVVPFGAYLVWRVATFGEWLPNTAIAKGQQAPTWEAFAQPVELGTYAGWPVIGAAAVVVVAAFVLGGPLRRPMVAVLVPFVLAVAAFTILQADWMVQLRFATPVWALGALLTVLSAAQLAAAFWSGRRLLTAAGVVVLGAAAVSSAPAMWEASVEFTDDPTIGVCVVTEHSGRMVNSYAAALGLPNAAAPNPSVLAPDLGGSAMASKLRLVDLAGLADAQIARFWASENYPAFADHIYDVVKPTFIKAHEFWFSEPGLDEDPRLERDYVEIASHGSFTDYVRRDAITDQAKLDALKVLAETQLVPAVEQVWSLDSCGDRLE